MLAREVLDRVPTDPGVYLFKDSRGKVVYVGKAKNLRSRVRQYFRPGGDERFFVAAGFLGRAVADIETLVVTAEKEALLLENHLIKQHQPRFNVKLRDDKQYLVLRLREPARLPPPPAPGQGPAPAPGRAALFPRVEVVRNIRDDGAMYFGPYHSATSARHTLRVLNRHFQLRTCTDHVLETRGRPCLQYQIKRCPGPCALPVSPEAYADQVDDVRMFLAGKDKELVARLGARMMARAEVEDYESAAHLRDSIAAVQRTLARQDIVQDDFIDQDVWGCHREADFIEVAVLFVRAGKLVGKRTFHQRDQELPTPEVLAEHIQVYYGSGTFIPDEVVVGVDLEDSEVLAEWLGNARGRKVRLIEPRRGTRARLVELADRNAAASAGSRRGQSRDVEALLAKVQARLGLARPPRRIECFDIAHLQGSETVASMVTFVDGEPAKALYRKFKVRSVQNDDFAAMYEVLTRRLRRAAGAGAPDDADAPSPDHADAPSPDHAGDLEEARAHETADAPPTLHDDGGDDDAHLDDVSDETGDEMNTAAADDAAAREPDDETSSLAPASPRTNKDDAWELPDLLVIDGGKGQLGMALAALRDLRIALGGRGLDVVGLAKERELESGDAPDRIYRPNVKDAIQLRPNSPELFLLARLRDEAHRFANTFHQQRRGKAALRSELEDIPGVGAARRRALLRQFGSVRGIRAAPLEELARCPGMTRAAAVAVRAFFDAADAPGAHGVGDEAAPSSAANAPPGADAHPTTPQTETRPRGRAR